MAKTSNATLTYGDIPVPIGSSYGYRTLLSLGLIKSTLANNNIAWQDLSNVYDNYVYSDTTQIADNRSEDDIFGFGNGLGFYFWTDYGVRLQVDPHFYTYTTPISDGQRIAFDYDTGLATRESFSIERGLSFDVGSNIQLRFVYNVGSVANKVRFSSSLGFVETAYHLEWELGARVTGYIEFSAGGDLDFTATVSGGGVTEVLTLSGVGGSSTGDLVLYNAGNISGTECKVYSFVLSDIASGDIIDTPVVPLYGRIIDRMIVGLDHSGTSPTLSAESGYYPFSPIFDLSTAEDIAYISGNTSGSATYFGEVVKYNFNAKPNTEDIYNSLTINGSISDLCPNPYSWTIDGISVPHPKSLSVTLNSVLQAQDLNSNAADIIGSGRDYGDIAQITLGLTPEECRLLLTQLISTRGATFSVVYYEGQYIFGRRHGGNVTATCVLADNRIELTHTDANNIDVKLALQIQGVS